MRLASLFLTTTTMCAALDLYTSLESIVAKPYYKLEQTVASKQIPAISSVEAPLRTLDGPGATFDHGQWDALLRRHVKDGRVDYAGLAGDRASFNSYTASLAAADVAALSPKENFAFHCNAYNALCVGKILDEKPTKSILDLSTKEQPVWDAPAGILGGAAVSLNDVEHKRLRLVFAEPRVHACLVCASVSCPDLAPYAFTGSKLDDQLADRTAAWLANPTKGAASERNRAVARLSRIFLWFEEDFGGGALAFARANGAALGGGDPALRYFEYDWSLNKS